METIRIAAVIDCKNWAWDIKADALQKFSKPKYEITKLYTRAEPHPTIDSLNNDYDLILVFAWGQGTNGRGIYRGWDKVTTPKALCKCSHFMARQASCIIAPSFDAVIVNNTFLGDIFSRYKTYYCPNGVDTEMFKPNHIEHNDFLAGYVGHGKSTGAKGFSDIIRPNVPEDMLLGLDRVTDSVQPHEWMPNYYNNLDAFLVMSKWEGTPNPGLEAMACGVPCISTKVGNMVEIIKDGENGFLIEREAEPMMEKINFYKDNPDIRKEHGKKVREVIEKDWDWRVKIKNYEDAFEGILNGE